MEGVAGVRLCAALVSKRTLGDVFDLVGTGCCTGATPGRVGVGALAFACSMVGSMGDSSGQLLLPLPFMASLPGPGKNVSRRSSAGGGNNSVVGGMGFEKSLGGDFFSLGSSARMPGFCWLLILSPATRIPLSSPYCSVSKLKGVKASTLLAALTIGLGPPVLLLLLIELTDDVVDEPDPWVLCWLFDRFNCCIGLGTGGASFSLWSTRSPFLLQLLGG